MSVLGGTAGRQTDDVGVDDDRCALHLADVFKPIRYFGHFSDNLVKFFDQGQVTGPLDLPANFRGLGPQVIELLLEALFELVEGRIFEARVPGQLLDRAEVVRVQELRFRPTADPNNLSRRVNSAQLHAEKNSHQVFSSPWSI